VRRRRAENRLSADETVALYARAVADAAGLEPDLTRAYVRGVLEMCGTDVVNVLRAQRWIRRGRPPGVEWES
jgi:hypothetical protein